MRYSNWQLTDLSIEIKAVHLADLIRSLELRHYDRWIFSIFAPIVVRFIGLEFYPQWIKGFEVGVQGSEFTYKSSCDTGVFTEGGAEEHGFLN